MTQHRKYTQLGSGCGFCFWRLVCPYFPRLWSDPRWRAFVLDESCSSVITRWLYTLGSGDTELDRVGRRSRGGVGVVKLDEWQRRDGGLSSLLFFFMISFARDCNATATFRQESKRVLDDIVKPCADRAVLVRSNRRSDLLSLLTLLGTTQRRSLLSPTPTSLRSRSITRLDRPRRPSSLAKKDLCAATADRPSTLSNTSSPPLPVSLTYSIQLDFDHDEAIHACDGRPSRTECERHGFQRYGALDAQRCDDRYGWHGRTAGEKGARSFAAQQNREEEAAGALSLLPPSVVCPGFILLAQGLMRADSGKPNLLEVEGKVSAIAKNKTQEFHTWMANDGQRRIVRDAGRPRQGNPD